MGSTTRKRSASRGGAKSSRAPAKRSRSRSRARAPARRRKRSLLELSATRDAIGLALIGAACYLFGVFFTSLDGGAVGSNVREASLLLIGSAAHVAPFVLCALGVSIVTRGEFLDPRPFRAGVAILLPTVLLTFGSDQFTLNSGTADPEQFGATYVTEHGGYAGAVLYYATYSLFGDVGTSIVCVLGWLLSVIFLTGSSVQAMARWWGRNIGQAARAAGTTSRGAARWVSSAAGEPVSATMEALTGARHTNPAPLDPAERFPDIFADVPSVFSVQVADDADTGAAVAQQPAAPRRLRRRRKKADPIEDDQQLELLEQVDTADDEPPAETIAEPVLRARTREGYRLPDPALLVRTPEPEDARPGDVDRIKRLLVETFGHFGIHATVTGMVPGPRVSRYELSLAPGTKMSKVENLRKDLAYALATTEIRILAPIPGKSAVGIEVENAKPSMVTLGDIHGKRARGASPLFVWFGKDISGKTIGADLAKMPHVLVAGTTGSGKSGCMNAMLSSILLGAGPDEVRMLLIDPKKVELSTYEGIPHLLTPVVTNVKKAANALGNVIAQMEERYAAMELAGVRTLPDFNRILVNRGDAPVPYTLIVIDELADLIMTAKRDVEDAVIRLAQKGRAAGFHLVLGTQRPSVDVITGMIKSNVPSRIAFAVSSQTDSRVILDQNGAETLLGSGDMLFKPVWARTPQRVQGAWVSEAEVRSLCDAARYQREPEYDESLLAEPESESADMGEVDEDDRLAEAIKLIAEFQTCSASFFQRRMRVGYTRGARLVDMLERRGLVSPGEGPRPRTVLITADDVPRLISDIQVGASTPD